MTVLQLTLGGTATDDKGVQSVRVSIRDNDSSRYLQANGSLGADFYAREATLGTPGGTSTTWTLPTINLPTEGDYSVTAIAYDTAGQQDPSTSGATSRYPIYPGDMPPTVLPELMQPLPGAVFDDGKIVISGRVLDDRQIAEAEVAVVDSLGQLHELERNVHEHQCQLAQRIPQLSWVAGIQLQLHDPGHPERRVPGPCSWHRQPRFHDEPACSKWPTSR